MSAGSSEARLWEEGDEDGSAGRAGGASASSSTSSESESESSSWSKCCGGGCSIATGQGSLDGTSAPEPSTRRRFARDDVAAAITAPRAGSWREVAGCR